MITDQDMYTALIERAELLEQHATKMRELSYIFGTENEMPIKSVRQNFIASGSSKKIPKINWAGLPKTTTTIVCKVLYDQKAWQGTQGLLMKELVEVVQRTSEVASSIPKTTIATLFSKNPGRSFVFKIGKGKNMRYTLNISALQQAGSPATKYLQ